LKLENDLAEKYNTSVVPKINEFIQTVHRDMKALPVLDDRFQRELDQEIQQKSVAKVSGMRQDMYAQSLSLENFKAEKE